MAKKQTDEQKQHLIKTRGYPMGYSSKEQYEKILKRSIPYIKQCVECGSTFEGIESIICCSDECKKINRRKRTQQTNLKRYGGLSPNCSKQIREKTKQTNLERYGVENPQQNSDVKQKTKQTVLKRYGSECHLNSVEYSQKRKDMLLEKYGVDNYFKRTDLVVDAIRRKYGDEITNPQQVKSIQEKTFNTRKSLYVLNGAVPKESSEKTCLEKYGNKSFFASDSGKMTICNLREKYRMG